MDSSMKMLLCLVKSALTEAAVPLPDDGSVEQVCALAVKHQVEAMAYDGAVRCGLSKQDASMKKLFQFYYRAMVKSEKQMAALDALYQSFGEAGIDYMPLKGCLMKRLYPRAELRAMNDADILIRTQQYNEIVPVLEKLRFVFLAESDCELKWGSRELYLELHKRLIPSFIKDFYAYFQDGWQLAVRHDGTRYYMSCEDEFLFLFTHFARHYREGGVGIRHMADIWYYRRRNPQMDEEKIREVLKKLSLDVFYENILKTLENWFEGGEETNITAMITEYIGGSGSFGTQESKVIASGAACGKGKRVMQLLFPPLGDMRYAYPVLKKCPALLPVMWGYRWVKVLTVQRGKLKTRHDQLQTMDEDKLEAFEQSMRAVGIGFEVEEN